MLLSKCYATNLLSRWGTEIYSSARGEHFLKGIPTPPDGVGNGIVALKLKFATAERDLADCKIFDVYKW